MVVVKFLKDVHLDFDRLYTYLCHSLYTKHLLSFRHLHVPAPVPACDPAHPLHEEEAVVIRFAAGRGAQDAQGRRGDRADDRHGSMDLDGARWTVAYTVKTVGGARA